MSRFFINRPIFATVISLVIIIAGLMASRTLPIAQNPEIAPPTVTVTATYPGASAETLAKTVAAPIEEQLNGVENMLYFNSTSSSVGTLTITITFEIGTNGDQAAINVNNRVQLALPRLPDEVRRTGVIVQKRSNDILMFVALRSPDKSRDTLYMTSYAVLNIVDELKRLPGVGDITVLGSDYAMRVWLKPDRMAQLGVTTTDIANAIRGQNAQYAAGKIGQDPAPQGQSLVYTVTARGRLIEPAEFGNIILRANGAGGVLRIKDVARVELGAQSYDITSSVNGLPSTGMAVFLQTGANALDTAKAIRAKMEELKTRLPTGVEYIIPFDTTRFVEASIHEVVKTLAIAAVLVALVVFVFLQNWRATLIPMLAVPVSLIGTFAGLWLFGFSINTLTLFALVLAIGIVVDDAIIVLENVERLMREQGMSPRDAALEAMREVQGAIVAIVLTLCAVFVPVAFLGGIAGTLYKQFAVTVAVAVVISGLVALTLTPALCALLLKPGHHEARIFRPFNRGFTGLTNFFLWTVGKTLHHGFIALVLFAVLVAATAWLFKRTPTSFVPAEDQGYFISALILPDGATLERTQRLGAQVREIISQSPVTERIFVISGFDLIGGGNKANAGTIFTILKPWEERSITTDDLIKQVFMKGAGLRDGLVLAFNPPPIRGLGTAGGFEVYVQARRDADPQRLAQVVNEFTGALRGEARLAGINTFFRSTVPQLYVDVDREKAVALGVPVNELFDTLQSSIGSLYVNDFNRSGRTYRVQMQADAPYRAAPEDLGKVYVRSQAGVMVPRASLISVRTVVGPEQLERYNGFLAAKVLGNGAPNVSSGDAIKLVEDVAARTLPDGYAIAWTGQAFQEKRAGSATVLALSFGIIMVFLILAAQYERWSLPLAVILAVPFAIFGALVAVSLRGMPDDIFFQIGLVVLVALAAKNAILIVEFASQKQAEGMAATDAAIEAARLRFRPIVMTSLAFVFGVLPLAFATGAGANARRSMGTGVVGGMLVATFVATVFVPLFFRWLSRDKQGKRAAPQAGATAEEH